MNTTPPRVRLLCNSAVPASPRPIAIGQSLAPPLALRRSHPLRQAQRAARAPEPAHLRAVQDLLDAQSVCFRCPSDFVPAVLPSRSGSRGPRQGCGTLKLRRQRQPSVYNALVPQVSALCGRYWCCGPSIPRDKLQSSGLVKSKEMCGLDPQDDVEDGTSTPLSATAVEYKVFHDYHQQSGTNQQQYN
eukprot:363357-Chlamydomonas_euryale.AAC.8